MKPFWEQVVATSTPQASVAKLMQPNELMASTR